jgi:UDP-N-acetylglucosamine 2-epimerase
MPVGYSTSIAFVKNAKRIVTDSGGVQREAFFAQKPCVTVFDYVVWPETMKGNWNQLSKPDTNEILNKLKITPETLQNYQPFGDGNSAEKIIDVLLS